jgi:hypothetical protein
MSIKIYKRKCKNPTCKKVFEAIGANQIVCSFECSIVYSKLLTEKKRIKEAKEIRKEMKLKIMTHKDWFKLLQIAVNTFVRLRDKHKPCVSCGRTDVEEFHAGHYISSTNSFLRFNELNIHKQCSYCNTHLRGNLIPYRQELIKRIGLNEVEKLESEVKKEYKISVPEIQELIKTFKEKIKLLNSNN